MSSSWWAAWGPVGFWVLLIFVLSSDGFSASSTAGVFDPLVRWLFPDIPDATLSTLHDLLRKGAHVGVYAGLSALVLRALRLRSALPLLRAAVLSLAFVVTVAAVDETHQSFTRQRTASVRDVGLDLVGGGVALALLAFLILGRGDRRRSATTDP